MGEGKLTNKKLLYTIGDISEICGVPIKTLRYYDEIKLLVPEQRDSETNYRYYTEEQMLILHKIRRLKSYGFSLDEIHSVLNGDGLLKEILMLKLSDIQEKIESFQSLYNEIIAELDKMNVKHGSEEAIVKIEDVPEKKWLYTRRIEKNFKTEFIPVKRWFEVLELLRKNQLKASGPITAIYHNQPIEQFLKSECDLEIGIPIKQCPNYPFCRTIPAYTAAVCFHHGTYENIINTYIKTIKWVNSNNFEISGPISEEYTISPLDLKNDGGFVTKIIVPVKKI